MMTNIILVFLPLLIFVSNARVSAAVDSDRNATADSAPVYIDDTLLFNVAGTAAFPARRRSEDIQARIEKICAAPAIQSSAIHFVDSQHSTDVMVNSTRIMSVFDLDASHEAVTRQVLAQAFVSKIQFQHAF